MKHSNSIECWRFWLIQSAQHPWKWLEVRWSTYRWTVARLYMAVEFWPRTSAAASRGTQTTITTVSQKTSGLYQWPPCPYLFCPGFQDRTSQRKFNLFPKSITKMSCCPPPASPWQELPIKTYLQLSPFSTIKLSHSPACLWASIRCKWWCWLTLLLQQALSK